MFVPKLTEEENELVNQLRSLDNDRFEACMRVLSFKAWEMELERKSEYSREKDDDFYLGRSRNRAVYYAQMRVANAVIELENAKNELIEIHKHYDNMEKDSPIHWACVKTQNGWKDVLVGDAARDYNQKPNPSTGKATLYLPHGEVVE